MWKKSRWWGISIVLYLLFSMNLVCTTFSLQIKTWCNVELRSFHFSHYPPHFQDLRTYAWKPIAISVSTCSTNQSIITEVEFFLNRPMKGTWSSDMLDLYALCIHLHEELERTLACILRQWQSGTGPMLACIGQEPTRHYTLYYHQHGKPFGTTDCIYNVQIARLEAFSLNVTLISDAWWIRLNQSRCIPSTSKQWYERQTVNSSFVP